MNQLSQFQTATPGMIVGRSLRGPECPLGLGEPFALRGGDRLGPDGIPLAIMHEHQPSFRGWVSETCRTLLDAERPWFRGAPLLLHGPRGAGRTHAARRLALAAGVPHVILNLSDPVIAANVAASRQVGETLWASPITIAMAASRCANPVVSVLGADRSSDDVASAVVSMMEPETSSAWIEDRLGVAVDLGEVTWILQCDQPSAVPNAILRRATTVALKPVPRGIDTVPTLSIVLEAMSDLGIDPRDPAFAWHRIRSHMPRLGRSAKGIYADALSALHALAHPASSPEGSHENTPSSRTPA